MQQGDQTVLSLRPGGGRPRLLGPRFELSSSSSSSSSSSFAFGSFSSDLPTLRPHGASSSSFSVKVCAYDGLLLDSIYQHLFFDLDLDLSMS